ncbi:MAG: Uma2 family endonuclease [Blastocatellia bacterium]|nr:Uma2 family endonuclease [Blastocatellia bacterium]
MAISVEEIGKEKKPVEAPPTRRDYFTVSEFREIRSLLPDYELELINGEITVNKRSPLQYISIEDFKKVADEFPDHRIELINGEIKMSPPPDKRHQKHSLILTRLFRRYGDQIEAMGCEIAVANCFFEVPDELVSQFRLEQKTIPSDVCPDAAVVYFDYLDTNRRPPALLAIEILSISNRENIERDTVTKPEVYAALEIPAYWIVDRRNQSVWVHTKPIDGLYTLRMQVKGDQVLPAPGMDFLRITPAQIFEE